MMVDNLYEQIFKRKSFHLFRNIGNEKISPDEIEAIYKKCATFTPLCEDIKVEMKIVDNKETNCKRGQEYCVMFYSEKKDHYLQNIGFLGEQLDLYLASVNIGALWYGIGKTDEKSYHGLDFVIMIAIAKVDDEEKFRKDMFKSKRKSIEEIWEGDIIPNVTELVRFAPSACNTQPWYVEHEDDKIKIYRYQEPGKRGIMPANKVSYYNQIDIGIFLCFLELCLQHEKIEFDRELSNTDNNIKFERKIPVATYQLSGIS